MTRIDQNTFYDTYALEYQQSRKTGKLVNDYSEVIYMKKKLASLRLDSSQKLLDIGCGYGVHLDYYDSLGYDTHGIDMSPGILKLCPKNLQTQVGTSEEIPFARNSFDVITSSLVFFHIHDIRKTFLEIIRTLKVGGHLIFTDINPEFSEKYGQKKGDEDILSLVRGKEAVTIQTRTIEEYNKVFENHGFSLLETEPCFPDISLQGIRERAYQILSKTPVFRLYHVQKN